MESTAYSGQYNITISINSIRLPLVLNLQFHYSIPPFHSTTQVDVLGMCSREL